MRFKNRSDAGRQLAQLLKQYKNQEAIVYGLPRGGVSVAAEISNLLQVPLEPLFAHKIGHPYHQEYAIAAISESGYMAATEREIELVDPAWLEREKSRQMQEIGRKRKLYLKGRKDPSVENKIAIIVDDGIATGLTLRAGIEELRNRNPCKIIAAVPVAPQETVDAIMPLVDDFVAVYIPERGGFLGSVGAYYDQFDQVEDDEVIAIIDKNHFREV